MWMRFTPVVKALAVLVLSAPLWAQDPVDARGWLNRGVGNFKAGNYPQAALDFQKAVDADPASSIARLYLGTAWMQQYIPGAQSSDNAHAAEMASRAFLKVLEMDPKNETAMSYLASLNLNEKKWDEAESWYQRVATVNPGIVVPWYSLGFIAWSRVYPAMSAARRSMGMKPEDPGPLPSGPVKNDLKSKYQPVIDSGLRVLQRALEIDPQYDDAMAYMNLLLRLRADLRDAAADYQHDTDEANQWVNKAVAIKQTKGNGAGADHEIPGRIRVSGEVMANMLILHEPPVVPEAARKARVFGNVVMSVIVGQDGAVKQVSSVSGPPELSQAAIDAVRHWTYKPTLLNNEPVEVETTVTVNFANPGK